MSDCGTTPGFPTASAMELLATNNAVVWEEICKLQQAILAAASQCQPGGGKMCTTVGGTTPMTFVTGVTSVSVTSPGAGYFQDMPAIRFVAPLGSFATGAIATITTNGGNIIGVSVVMGSEGYQPIPSTMSVSTIAGINAVLEPLIDAAGRIVAVNIVNSGSGYATSDSVSAARAIAPNPAYVNAVFQIASVSLTGEILAVIVSNPGSGYDDSVATIEIVSAVNPAAPYPLGTGFAANVLTDVSGVVMGAVISNTGYGYATYSPYLVITDPGTGATTQVNLLSDTIASVTVLTPGTNYTQFATGTIFNPPTTGLPNPPLTPASVSINVDTNTYGTNPGLYYQVWAGLATNRAISSQLNTVLTYFKGLGYTISIQSNPATGNTISWKICW
jgi:hypothetical protein